MPSEPIDYLIKFIDGSETGYLPHVMLAVVQNEHVWVCMAALHNQPTRGYHRVLAELLNSIFIVITKATPGTLHQYMLPAGMTAHAGWTHHGKGLPWHPIIYDVQTEVAVLKVTTILTQHRLRRTIKVKPGAKRPTKGVVILHQSPSGHEVIKLRQVGKLRRYH